MDSRSPPDPDTDPKSSIDSTVAEEVTRVEWVRYLQGASGHAVLSLSFLVAAMLFVRLDRAGVGAMAVVVAYGVALNGISIYAWDRLRIYFASVVASPDDARSPRTLTPHRIPTEMKAEFLTGFTMVVAFSAALAFGMAALRTIGFGLAAYLAVGVLAFGNVVTLAWKFHATSRR